MPVNGAGCYSVSLSTGQDLEPQGVFEPMDQDTISTHIAAFTSNDDEQRDAARRALEEAGAVAVPALIQALGDDVRRVQWEAAKALISIGDPKSADAFAAALEDNDLDIRWLASEGIVKLGRPGLEALLRMLAKTTDQHAHDSAILILNRFRGEHGEALAPVLDALRSRTVDSPVMVAAHQALSKLGPG